GSDASGESVARVPAGAGPEPLPDASGPDLRPHAPAIVPPACAARVSTARSAAVDDCPVWQPGARRPDPARVPDRSRPPLPGSRRWRFAEWPGPTGLGA